MNKEIRNSLIVFIVILPIFLVISILLWVAYSGLGTAISLAVFASIIVFAQVYLSRDNKMETRHALGEVQALNNLFRILDIDRPIPALGGYVITAAMAKVLIGLLYRHKPATIVELGSGVSTLLMAYAVKKLGRGKIYSFDHEQRFVEQTRELLREHGLEAYAEVTCAPLKSQQINGQTWNWYGIPAERGFDSIDLLIADGPPAQTQKWARYPAFPFFKDLLNKQAIVVLDDTHRKEELQIAQRWAGENSGWSCRIDRGARCTVLYQD